jgi:hypothetical protein
LLPVLPNPKRGSIHHAGPMDFITLLKKVIAITEIGFLLHRSIL